MAKDVASVSLRERVKEPPAKALVDAYRFPACLPLAAMRWQPTTQQLRKHGPELMRPSKHCGRLCGRLRRKAYSVSVMIGVSPSHRHFAFIATVHSRGLTPM